MVKWLFVSKEPKKSITAGLCSRSSALPAPKGYDFLLAMMNYVPGALLAGYLSGRKQEPFFRGGGVWAQAGNNTIRTSKIEIV